MARIKNKATTKTELGETDRERGGEEKGGNTTKYREMIPISVLHSTYFQYLIFSEHDAIVVVVVVAAVFLLCAPHLMIFIVLERALALHFTHFSDSAPRFR